MNSFLIQDYNWSFDWLIFALILYNFSIVGLVSVFWTAPLLIQQGYLIIISALLVIFLFFFLKKNSFLICYSQQGYQFLATSRMDILGSLSNHCNLWLIDYYFL